jgi:hypothetical protein
MPTSLYVDQLKSQSQFDPPDVWLLTFSNFVFYRSKLYDKVGATAAESSQDRNAIEISGAHKICLDKLDRKLHTNWYVTGYN